MRNLYYISLICSCEGGEVLETQEVIRRFWTWVLLFSCFFAFFLFRSTSVTARILLVLRLLRQPQCGTHLFIIWADQNKFHPLHLVPSNFTLIRIVLIVKNYSETDKMIEIILYVFLLVSRLRQDDIFCSDLIQYVTCALGAPGDQDHLSGSIYLLILGLSLSS